MKASGFTLIEVVITVAVVAVLASLAAPSFTGFIAGQRVKTASFDLMASITLARSEAIKRSAAATTTADVAPTGGDWASGWTVSVWDATATPPARRTVGSHEALADLTVSCISAGEAVDCATLSYLGSGRLTASVPSIQISNPNTANVRCVSIDLSGLPSSKASACP